MSKLSIFGCEKNLLRLTISSFLVVILGLPYSVLTAQHQAVYLYDDLGRLARVVDQTTGICADYNYDAVGNILSVTRQGNCAGSPAIKSVTPVPESNSFTMMGQNLLGATVSVDIPHVYVSEVRASDTTLSFRLRGSEIFCMASGKAVISTPFGSVEIPITSVGAQHLTLGRALSGSLGQVGQTNFYCLDLPSPTSVVVEVGPAPGSDLLPCISVFRDVRASPIPDGTACATTNSSVSVVDTDLAAGLHFIAVSGTNFTAGAYSIIVKPPLVLAQGTVEVALPNDRPTAGLAIALAAPVVEAALPGSQTTDHYPVTLASPIVDALLPRSDAGSEGGGVFIAVPPLEVSFQNTAEFRLSPPRPASAGTTNTLPVIKRSAPLK